MQGGGKIEYCNDKLLIMTELQNNKDVLFYNEDCRITLGRIADGTIDLMLQDPPYGVTRNRWDIKPALALMWPEWMRVTKERAAMLFFAQQPFASELVLSAPKLFRYDLIWEKTLPTGFLNAGRMPLRNHEHILVFTGVSLFTIRKKRLAMHGKCQAPCTNVTVRRPVIMVTMMVTITTVRNVFQKVSSSLRPINKNPPCILPRSQSP